MNYERIYSEFIADRLTKQPVKPAYFEKHHIVPRSLGGGDEAHNLIALTPEDHFFAHLLLAKIHGGKLWSPIAFMVGGSRKDYKPTHSRIAHGWASRAMSKAKQGENAPQYDFTEYSFVNQDGREWIGKQSDLYSKLGLSRSLANMLVKGRVSVANGWYLAGTTPKDLSGASHPMYRADVHSFVHRDGRKFMGTQFEFGQYAEVDSSGACELVKMKRKEAKGWRISGNDAAAAYVERIKKKQALIEQKAKETAALRIQGIFNSSDKREYSWRDVATGEEFKATKTAVKSRYGCRSGDLSSLFSGRQKTSKGVALAEVKEAIQRREGSCLH